jgi:hypothetical protein
LNTQEIQPVIEVCNDSSHISNDNEEVTENMNKLINEMTTRTNNEQEPIVESEKNNDSQSENEIKIDSTQVQNENNPQELNNEAATVASETETVRSTAPIQIIDFQTEWAQLSDNEKTLGLLAPTWLPDTEADVCMRCSVKF